MIKLTKTQRDQWIAVALGAAAVIACLWYLVVMAQNKQLDAATANCVKMRKTLKDASDKVRQAESVGAELAKSLEALKQREAGFAPEHEPFSWMMEKMRNFQLPANEMYRYKSVSIADIKPPEITDKGVRNGETWMREKMRSFQLPANEMYRYKSVSIADIKPPEITDKGVITGFPYKWAKFHITGEGYYHEFGKFIADFENAFPCFRIQDLDIAVPGIRKDPDMLSYSFDIVTPDR